MMKRYVTEAITLSIYLIAMWSMAYLIKHPGTTSIAARRARRVLAKVDISSPEIENNGEHDNS
jgi:hypothetical protein